MQHSFSVEIAKEYGILEAILLQNIYYWIEKNKANNKHFCDGRYWTYSSQKAFAELIPYATERKIQLALERLIKNQLLDCGNYNKVAFDRTKWYSITQKGYIVLQNVESDTSKMLNENTQNVEPIPNINTNIKEDNNKLLSKKKFIKPTVEEVREYCQERNNNINPEHFIDYYESNGWKVGRNAMKDWKATIRTWENNNRESKISNSKDEVVLKKISEGFFQL